MDEEATSVNVYCDESRHTSDPSDKYMVIGAIACPRPAKREVVGAIHRLQARHRAHGEIGWKRVSPNRKELFWDLIQLFETRTDLDFRCLVVNRETLDHSAYSGGDDELGFYKLYYQMLVHWLKPGNAYHIYLDWQQNRGQRRFASLKYFLRRRLSGRAKIICLEPVSSASQPLIGLTDLFIGAVGYAWNHRSASSTKKEFCSRLAKAAGLAGLRQATGPARPRFNIFHFSGR
jgi:hypothetical protein